MRYGFILMIFMIMLAGCSQEEPKTAYDTLPEGNADKGAELFTQGVNGGAACDTCHRLDDNQSTGPALAGYAERAESRVSGQDASEYTYYSILRPSKHVVSGFSNVMPNDYEDKFSDQQLADLIAYLLTL